MQSPLSAEAPIWILDTTPNTLLAEEPPSKCTHIEEVEEVKEVDSLSSRL